MEERMKGQPEPADVRREEILNAALELFSTRGPGGTRIQDLAARAGISQGLMYHYFSSKEEVHRELIVRAFQRIAEACDWLESQEMPAGDKIRLALTGWLEMLNSGDTGARNHLIIAQASAAEDTPPEIRRILEENHMMPYRSMAAIMEKGQQEGTVLPGDPMDLALTFWSVLNGLAIFRVVHPESFRSPDPGILLRMFLAAEPEGGK